MLIILEASALALPVVLAWLRFQEFPFCHIRGFKPLYRGDQLQRINFDSDFPCSVSESESQILTASHCYQ